MPKNTVLQRPQRKGNLPRNGFDRGFETKINMSAGMLLPVFCEPVLGGSHIKINRQQIMRAAQLNTVAMPRIDMNIDFYFVPYRQLYTFYGQSRTATKDMHSSLRPNLIDVKIPTLSPSVLTGLIQNTSGRDDLGYYFNQGVIRLLDLLRYGVTPHDDIEQDSEFTPIDDTLPAQNPLKLCAYQKVYYDHYRLSNYESNDPTAYNLDQFLYQNGSVGNITQQDAEKFVKLHYVPYRKDFMTNVYPSLNFAATNDIQIRSAFKVANNVVNSALSSEDFSYSDISLNELRGQNIPSVDLNVDPEENFTTFSAQTIRALFALDKMTRLAAYALQHVADQFEARFGFRPVAEDMNESLRIGSFRADMSISEVLSTAVTEGADLGTLGGRGLSIDDWSNTIEFNCKEEGLVIGVAYVLPRISYDSFMVDSFNTISSWANMPQPEMESLGLEPFYQSELYLARTANEDDHLEPYGLTLDDFNNMVRGYRPSWQRWKLGVDQNHGIFNLGLALNHFTTHTKYDYIRKNLMTLKDGGLTFQYFLCDPADLNSIFVQGYQGSQYYDQFFGMIRFGFSAIQNMPVLGVPDL